MKDKIESALISLDLTSEIKRIDLFHQYVEQLQYWNKVYNLTAIRNVDDILIHHLFDCLAIIPKLRSLYPESGRKIADIGSGGGLPGIIIAICQPEWEVYCVDTVGKKTSFIKQAAGILGLKNLHAIHNRVEQLDSLGVDILISRAFSSLLDFVNLAQHHLQKDGVFLAMKGVYPEQEINDLQQQTNWHLSQYIDLDVPGLDANRCLLLIEQ